MLSCTMHSKVLMMNYNHLELIEHTSQRPFIRLCHSKEKIDMYRGNFFIEDSPLECLDLTEYSIAESFQEGKARCTITFSNGPVSMQCEFSEEEGRLLLRFSELPKPYNRLSIRLSADENEHIWGCGEQFSYFDLRGHNYPLWTGEQGVGRNKATEITQIADKLDRAGGDYHTTFYPQPTFVSSRNYFMHAETDGYADFDFSQSDHHRLTFWDVPSVIYFSWKPTLLSVVQDISMLLGRQRELPSWVYDGVILGIQGGTQTCLDKMQKAQSMGVPVVGIWAQDWEGEKYTSFGKRLRWNWQWDQKLYPGLDVAIGDLKRQGVHFLGYINPYVLENDELYAQAKNLDLLAKREDGSIYLVDFGEFDAGIVDFTNHKAFDWYKEVVQKYLIDFGLDGWMADFGEYLPTDVVLSNNRSALLEHNAWPGYWAELNRQAVDDSGKANEIIYFMRAGNARSLSACPMMWAGDQNVDWSEDDGLPSVITSALSLAMSGMGLQHSDIGGYTTLYGMRRSKELLLRWLELAAFTPMMRTHEGNRPKDNWQFDSDEDTLKAFAAMTLLHIKLKPYLQDAVRQNAEEGIPVMRPLFLHYEKEAFLTAKDCYLLGRDLLVAPILHKGQQYRTVELPDDLWIHLFTKQSYSGGIVTVPSPIGQPAVFYRAGSQFESLFQSII